MTFFLSRTAAVLDTGLRKEACIFGAFTMSGVHVSRRSGGWQLWSAFPGAPPEERAARVVGGVGVLRSVFTILKQIVLLSRFFVMIRFNVLGKVSKE